MGEQTEKNGKHQLGGQKNPNTRPLGANLFAVACFVDWENVRKLIFEGARGHRLPRIDYNEPSNLIHFFQSFLLPNERFYRIFLYLSEPLSSYNWNGTAYDMTSHPAYRRSVAFIYKMQQIDLIAVRKGKLKPTGKGSNPVLVQKQVDMLLGLDVAHIAYRQLAERILMFSYDTDVIPALKTARINGTQVIIAECPDIRKLSPELKAHTDFTRSIPFGKIFEKSGEELE